MGEPPSEGVVGPSLAEFLEDPFAKFGDLVSGW
jgi:hypothetical protein